MSDYRALLDADVLSFIEEVQSWYPPDAAHRSVSEQRRIYDQMCAGFVVDYPAGVKSQNDTIQTATHRIPIRKYNCDPDPRAVVIYYHGGGFVVGGLDSHDDVCAEICGRAGFEVVSVDYRLSPEHPFPADFEDAKAAFNQINASTELPVVLVGDSAGGCLAASIAHASRHDKKPPVGQVLIYPVLGGDIDKGSYITHADAPLLTRQDMIYYHNIRTGGDLALLDDPRCSPLRDHSFSKLPPSYILSADCDPLASDSEDYYRHLKRAGGEVVWVNEECLVHGFLRARHKTQKGAASFERIVTATKSMGLTGGLPE